MKYSSILEKTERYRSFYWVVFYIVGAAFLGSLVSCSADFSDGRDSDAKDTAGDTGWYGWPDDTEQEKPSAEGSDPETPTENDDTEIDTETGPYVDTQSEEETETGPDRCPNDPEKTEPGQCGCGIPEGQCADFCEEAKEKELLVLECGSGTIDSIDFASFGIYGGSCVNGPTMGECHYDGTANVVETACLGESRCQLIADKKEVFDDVCGKDKHSLVVEYRCVYQTGCDDSDLKLSPGKCGCNTPDIDVDGDGSADCNDECDNHPDKIEAGVCGCEADEKDEKDEDNDGLPGCLDECDKDPEKTEPGLCGCGKLDVDIDDRDGDGTIDCRDKCPDDPNKKDPGHCGCHEFEDTTDSDLDSTPDCADECPSDPRKAHAGFCGCGRSESSCGFCLDTPDYRDPQGYKCKDWQGYNCHSVEQYGYTSKQGAEIREYCTKSCGLCSS